MTRDDAFKAIVEKLERQIDRGPPQDEDIKILRAIFDAGLEVGLEEAAELCDRRARAFEADGAFQSGQATKTAGAGIRALKSQPPQAGPRPPGACL